MMRAVQLARRQIPFSTALPWVLLLALSPFWFVYIDGLFHVMRAFAATMLLPHHQAPAVLDSDFTQFWSAGRLAADSNARHIYNVVWFANWQHVHVAQVIPPFKQYLYPPPNMLMTLMTVPFGFNGGFLFWTVALTTIGVIALRRSGMPWPMIGLGVGGAAFAHNMALGQFGFVTGALFIAGLLTIDRKPCIAGVLFGMLAIKPQAGLIGPVALLARRRYGGVATGVIVTACLCLAVTLICGWAIWPAYVSEGMMTAHRVLIAPFPTIYEIDGASVFWMFRSLGASVTLAGIAQLASASGAVIWCWIAWRRPETDRIALVALTVALTLLVTPYGFITDMCGFSLMVAWLAWERRRLDVADVLMWMWPALCAPVSVGLHAELTPLILLLGALRAWRRLTGPALSGGVAGPVYASALQASK